jgi:trehalose 6-phosphate synthase/phosphatase
MLAQQPVEILHGEKVLEVRPHGVTKALAAKEVADRLPHSAILAAFGDDRTDEDLFAALPPDAISFHVGVLPTRATHRLEGPKEVRNLLRQIVEVKQGAAQGPEKGC